MNLRQERTLRDYRVVMTAFYTVDPALVRRVRTELAALETVSHSPTKNYDGPARRSSEEPGGKRPPGSDAEHPSRDDVGEWAAYHDSHYRRTVSYFRREIAGCRSLLGLRDIHTELTATVAAWRRQPAPTSGHEPQPGDPQWKRYVAESDEDARSLAARFWNPDTGKHYSTRRINQIRQEYRETVENDLSGREGNV